MNTARPLSFRDVDGLALSSASGQLTPSMFDGLSLQALDAGPVVELASLIAGQRLPEWVSDRVAPGRTSLLLRTVIGGNAPPPARNGDSVGVVAMSQGSDSAFMSFNLAARKAAEASGFSNKAAAQFGAALMELRSNVEDHSQASHTGIIFFAARDNSFEFGVTDRGQGVLSSLRSCSHYECLENHGDALRLAVSEGASRYGPGTMHGYGFRPIFLGLAGYRGYLRWRSGDHALTIDARDPNASLGTVAQKAFCDGLTLSVSCAK